MKVTIDGLPIEAPDKMTILDLARERKIYIPSLCHYPGLIPFAGCRLCLVAVKGRKAFVPACSTFIEEGMDVATNTPVLQKLRRQILELILSEHANPCLSCGDQSARQNDRPPIREVHHAAACRFSSTNGRCDFQKVIDYLKPAKIKFPSLNGHIEIRKDDPLLDRNDNLCILCGRCVRVCHEIRGVSAIAFVYRGSRAGVGTSLGRRLLDTSCQFCGACLDVCPTGALTEKTMTGGIVPDEEKKTVCGFCGQGCELSLILKEGKVLGSVPTKKGSVNQGQACVKGRFLVSPAVYHPHRLAKPMVRKNGKLEEATWDEALAAIARRLSGGEAGTIALAGSAQDSCEDIFALEKFGGEGLKTEHVTVSGDFSAHARFWDFGRALDFQPRLNFKISELGHAKTIVLFGENLAVTQPMVWMEVYRSIRNGGKLLIVGPEELCIRRCASSLIKLQAGQESELLTGLSRILLESGNSAESARIEGFSEFKKHLEGIKLSIAEALLGLQEEKLLKLALYLEKRKPVAFLFGAEFCAGGSGSANLASLWNLALQTQGTLIPLSSETNARGALEISLSFRKKDVPPARIVQAISEGSFKTLYIVGSFPPLKKKPAEFVIVQGSFLNGTCDSADVVLPQTTFAETEGTFVNVEGRLHRFERAIEPLGDSQPGWRIFGELARKMGMTGFSFKSAADVFQELVGRVPGFHGLSREHQTHESFLQEPSADCKKFAPADVPQDGDTAANISVGPDVYRGLDMSRDIKELRLIRGR